MLRTWKKGAAAGFPFRISGQPVPIVSDAAIATDAVGDGRFVPLVILDTRERPDISQLIEIQDKVPPGDVVSAWGRLLSSPSNHMALFLQFQRPIETGFTLDFDLSRQGSVIDLAMRAHAIYLQAGKPGDRLYRTLDSPRMVAELGGEMPASQWEDLWLKAVIKRLQAEGLGRHEAKRGARVLIDQLRSKLRNVDSFGSGGGVPV